MVQERTKANKVETSPEKNHVNTRRSAGEQTNGSGPQIDAEFKKVCEKLKLDAAIVTTAWNQFESVRRQCTIMVGDVHTASYN
jgi:hypothetical protein